MAFIIVELDAKPDKSKEANAKHVIKVVEMMFERILKSK